MNLLETTLCALVSSFVITSCANKHDEDLNTPPTKHHQSEPSKSEPIQKTVESNSYEGHLLSIKGYYCDVMHGDWRGPPKRHYHCEVLFQDDSGKQYYVFGYETDTHALCKLLMIKSERVLSYKHLGISGGTDKEDKQHRIKERYGFTRTTTFDDNHHDELIFSTDSDGKSMGPRVEVESLYAKDVFIHRATYSGVDVIHLISLMDVEFTEFPFN